MSTKSLDNVAYPNNNENILLSQLRCEMNKHDQEIKNVTLRRAVQKRHDDGPGAGISDLIYLMNSGATERSIIHCVPSRRSLPNSLCAKDADAGFTYI